MSTAYDAVEPLIRRKIFASEEDAVRTLVRDYILEQVSTLQQDIVVFERKYGMNLEQFGAYLHERSILLSDGEFSVEQRQALGQAVMLEEEDWLDWKVSSQLLESWLDLRQEAVP